MNTRTLLVLLASLLLLGCGEQKALSAAQASGTPEAYEAFLEQYPNTPHAPILRTQIEDLRYHAAKDGEGPKGWREYLKHHPEGKHVKAAKRHEDEASYDAAHGLRTAAAYQGYLDSHPTGRYVKQARAEMDELAYQENISIENYRVERVNLANDPKGDLNGWGLYADVTNNGERILIEVELKLEFTDPAGKVIGDRTWWVAAEELFGMPTPPRIKPPLRAGMTREFQFTTGEPPEGWVDTFTLRPTNLRFRQ
ncbi:MAG: hypothetical protein KDA24_04570 [Deltaproteobacteria bacterium]|nr:hypothetical protein [Deltaproteobacteria bacterium]